MSSRTLIVMAFAAAMAQAKTLLILPLTGDLEKASDISTVYELYKDALQAGYKGEVKTVPNDSAHACSDKGCAMKLAAGAGADEVVYSTIKRLGSKWFFSSTVMDAGGGNAFIQRGTSQNLEDMEAVTRRVADAILARKSFDEVASIENITPIEENSERTSRRALVSSGFSLGYLLPTGGSYAYLEGSSSFFGRECPNSCTERQPYSQMVRFTWINSMEFRKDLMLGFDAAWALPNVIGGDINLKYLFSRTDFSPFVGGGMGIQYVIPLDDSLDDSKRNSGPALSAQGGMVFFRTYDIQLIAKAQYQFVFNTDMDNGLSYDLGIVYRPSSNRRSGFWSSFWKIYLAGILVASIAGAAAN